MGRSLPTLGRAACLAAALAIAAAPAPAGLPLLEAGDDGLPTLAPLLERVTPAVVNISVVSQAPDEENPLFRDPFFRWFFELPDRPREERRSMASGSGVIVDAQRGYVLTNHHVIENAQQVKVTLKDRREFIARVVGSDEGTDIALLHIRPQNLTAIPFGQSDALKVGDFVVAIGNPFGLGQTVTSGIVSALGRTGLSVENYEDFIQTDASINPGNSGGALINLKGELIGINTAIIGPSGGNVGIGFAVPSRMARAVMEQLAQHGEVRRGRLGVSVQDLTPDIAQALGIDTRTRGAVIGRVEARSAAAEAGLRAGDVVVAVDGRSLRSASDLRNRVGLTPIGQTIRLELVRNGRTSEITARVGRPTAATAVPPRGGFDPRLDGAAFRDGAGGVQVGRVEAGSPAWQAGLRGGDVIVAVNRRPVQSTRDLAAVLDAQPRVLAMSVNRDGRTLFLVVQ